MKKLTAIIVTGMSLCMSSGAFAAEPVQFTGDVAVKYQKDTAEGAENTSGVVGTFRLKAEAELGSGWSMYSRFGAQYTSRICIDDINREEYAQDKKGVLALDQFGFSYKNNDFTYKLGRQDVTIGTTALLYSRSDSNIGKRAFVDGLTINGKSGAVDLSLVAAREDKLENNKLYAIHAGYSPSDSFNWGVTLGRYQDAVSDVNTNHWAIDGTYHYGKAALTAEFAKSNASDENKAHAMTLNYSFDDKTSAYITGFRVENNASMGGQSDFDAGNRGTHYGITYAMSDRDTIEMVYKDQKEIGGNKNTSFELSYSRSF